MSTFVSTINQNRQTVVVSEDVITIPESARIIMMDSVGVTPKEYARRTGESYAAVRKKIAEGRLPTLKMAHKGQESGTSTIYINMMKLAEIALDKEY